MGAGRNHSHQRRHLLTCRRSRTQNAGRQRQHQSHRLHPLQHHERSERHHVPRRRLDQLHRRLQTDGKDHSRYSGRHAPLPARRSRCRACLQSPHPAPSVRDPFDRAPVSACAPGRLHAGHRRRRPDEHHAGQRAAAHPRNRRGKGSGRAAPSHPHPVSG